MRKVENMTPGERDGMTSRDVGIISRYTLRTIFKGKPAVRMICQLTNLEEKLLDSLVP